jgi:hypothetical protein
MVTNTPHRGCDRGKGLSLDSGNMAKEILVAEEFPMLEVDPRELIVPHGEGCSSGNRT